MLLHWTELLLSNAHESSAHPNIKKIVFQSLTNSSLNLLTKEMMKPASNGEHYNPSDILMYIDLLYKFLKIVNNNMDYSCDSAAVVSDVEKFASTYVNLSLFGYVEPDVDDEDDEDLEPTIPSTIVNLIITFCRKDEIHYNLMNRFIPSFILYYMN